MIGAALLILSATAAQAEPEGAERRADRLRTIELNQRAKARSDARDNAEARRVAEINRAARARYEKRMAEWRRQVAACRSGDYSACDD